MYYYDVCEPGYWWVTTAIEVVFVLVILALTLWIIRLGIDIYTKREKVHERSRD